MVVKRGYGWVCLAVLPAVVLSVQLSAAEPSNDWPQFRGVNRDGISSETGLADSWPESGPKELWRVPMGPGYSGISIVGDRLYTAFGDGEGEEAQEYVGTFDVKTGKELWRTAIGGPFENTFGGGSQRLADLGARIAADAKAEVT